MGDGYFLSIVFVLKLQKRKCIVISYLQDFNTPGVQGSGGGVNQIFLFPLDY